MAEDNYDFDDPFSEEEEKVEEQPKKGRPVTRGVPTMPPKISTNQLPKLSANVPKRKVVEEEDDEDMEVMEPEEEELEEDIPVMKPAPKQRTNNMGGSPNVVKEPENRYSPYVMPIRMGLFDNLQQKPVIETQDAESLMLSMLTDIMNRLDKLERLIG